MWPTPSRIPSYSSVCGSFLWDRARDADPLIPELEELEPDPGDGESTSHLRAGVGQERIYIIINNTWAISNIALLYC